MQNSLLTQKSSHAPTFVKANVCSRGRWNAELKHHCSLRSRW